MGKTFAQMQICSVSTPAEFTLQKFTAERLPAAPSVSFADPQSSWKSCDRNDGQSINF